MCIYRREMITSIFERSRVRSNAQSTHHCDSLSLRRPVEIYCFYKFCGIAMRQNFSMCCFWCSIRCVFSLYFNFNSIYRGFTEMAFASNCFFSVSDYVHFNNGKEILFSRNLKHLVLSLQKEHTQDEPPQLLNIPFCWDSKKEKRFVVLFLVYCFPVSLGHRYRWSQGIVWGTMQILSWFTDALSCFCASNAVLCYGVRVQEWENSREMQEERETERDCDRESVGGFTAITRGHRVCALMLHSSLGLRRRCRWSQEIAASEM